MLRGYHGAPQKDGKSCFQDGFHDIFLIKMGNYGTNQGFHAFSSPGFQVSKVFSASIGLGLNLRCQTCCLMGPIYWSVET